MAKRRTTTAVLLALLAAGACRPASDYVSAPPVERAPSAFSTARYALATGSLGAMALADSLNVPTATVAPEPGDVGSAVALIDPVTAPPLCGEACGEPPTGAVAEGPTWRIGTALSATDDVDQGDAIDSGQAVEVPPLAPVASVSATPWLVSSAGGPGQFAAFLTIPMSAQGVETWLDGDPARRVWCAPIPNTFG